MTSQTIVQQELEEAQFALRVMREDRAARRGIYGMLSERGYRDCEERAVQRLLAAEWDAAFGGDR